jgi:hypothetical protein
MAEPGCRTLVGKLASPSNQLAASGASIMVHVSVMLVLLGVGSTCTHTHLQHACASWLCCRDVCSDPSAMHSVSQRRGEHNRTSAPCQKKYTACHGW